MRAMLSRADSWLRGFLEEEMREPAGASAPGGRPPLMPWGRVLRIAFIVFAAVGLAAFTVGQSTVVVVIGCMMGLLTAQSAPAGVAGTIVTVVGSAGLLGVGSAEIQLLLVLPLSALVGWAVHHGWSRPALQAMMFWSIFSAPFLPEGDRVGTVALFMAGAAWSLGMAQLLGIAEVVPRARRASARYGAVCALVLAVGLGATVWYGHFTFGQHGFWLPLTFVAFCLPPHVDLPRRLVERLIGTALGVAVVAALGALAPAPIWLLPAALVAYPLGFRVLPRHHWLFVCCITVAILSALGLLYDPAELAQERIGAALAAAGLVVVLVLAGGLLLGLARRASLRGSARDAADPLQGPSPTG